MKLIFCVDKQKGILFFGKRHSDDKVLRNRLLEIIGSNKLWVSEYTANQFYDYPDRITVDNDYLSKSGIDDYCFVEDGEYCIDDASEVILCHWNRQYPSDKFFTVDLAAEGFKKVSEEELVGSSHDKITIQTYKRG